MDSVVDLRPEGLSNYSRPNCGVVAVAAALNENYNDVEESCRRLNGYGGNWNGGTSHADRSRVVDSYGKELKKVEGLPRKKVDSVVPLLDPSKRYIVRVGGHAMAYIYGKLVDQSGSWDVSHPRRRRKIVTYVHEVVEPGSEASQPKQPEESKRPKNNKPYLYGLYVNGRLEKKYKRRPNQKIIDDWNRYSAVHAELRSL